MNLLYSTPAQETLVFVDIPTTIFVRPLIREIYQSLGITIDFLDFPPERAIQNADSGEADGFTLAYPTLLHAAPNLVLVPEAFYKEPVIAYVKTGIDIAINGWNSIRSFSIGIVRGHQLVEINTAGFKYLQIADDPTTLFTLLKNDRIDIALYYPSFFHKIFDPLDSYDVVPLEPPLMLLPVYTFLHKKHEHLIPLVNQRIKEMKESGRMDEILDEILQIKKPLGQY